MQPQKYLTQEAALRLVQMAHVGLTVNQARVVLAAAEYIATEQGHVLIRPEDLDRAREAMQSVLKQYD